MRHLSNPQRRKATEHTQQVDPTFNLCGRPLNAYTTSGRDHLHYEARNSGEKETPGIFSAHCCMHVPTNNFLDSGSDSGKNTDDFQEFIRTAVANFPREKTRLCVCSAESLVDLAPRRHAPHCCQCRLLREGNDTPNAQQCSAKGSPLGKLLHHGCGCRSP